MIIPLSAIQQIPSRTGLTDSEVGHSILPNWAPHLPQAHLFTTDAGTHLFLPDGSRIYGLSPDTADLLLPAVAAGDGARMDALLAEFGLLTAPYVEDRPIQSPPLRALSLAIAQKCNLGCTYCYADGGDFGGGGTNNMTQETALAAVDLLLRDLTAGDRAQLIFLGGEPLINRPVLRTVTEVAAQRAQASKVALQFSITTNGTLLTPDDAEFFARHGFAVTVSIDGVGPTHDRLRPHKSGAGSYERIIERVQPLLAQQGRMQVSARATVTPANLDLLGTLDTLIELGFHSVGFSPLLRSPTGQGEMGAADLDAMLAAMIACGQEYERQVVAGNRYPFLNMMTALQELHRGTHRPYPCGAGAGYFGVSADGDLFACHRFVGDADGAMGDIDAGVDASRQNRWLAERHVHRQEPCGGCWARYLCGGGCHHEVIRRGRPACDYIRGWLHYCLQAYVRLSAACPHLFS
jgi:uncharacterized protein